MPQHDALNEGQADARAFELGDAGHKRAIAARLLPPLEQECIAVGQELKKQSGTRGITDAVSANITQFPFFVPPN